MARGNENGNLALILILECRRVEEAEEEEKSAAEIRDIQRHE